MDSERDLQGPRTATEIYRTRGDEVDPCRPIMTGDVFRNVVVIGDAKSESKLRDVMIIQHPCSLRGDGITLAERVWAVKVQTHAPVEDWAKNAKVMPLPDLRPEASTSRNSNFAAMFETPYLVDPANLEGRREACLSPMGINLLFQRLVFNSSRTAIATHVFQECNAHVYEEADLAEDWCMERQNAGVTIDQATKEVVVWLREEPRDGGPTRQARLRDAQQRSVVRQEMRRHVRQLGKESAE